MTAQVELKGLEDVRKALRALPSAVGDKATKSALRAAAKVIEDEVRANAQTIDDPTTRERIAANVTLRFSSQHFKRTGDPMFRVGILGGAQAPETAAKERKRRRAGSTSLQDLGEIAGKGKGNPGGDTWYWRLIEFGTSKMGARPFIRPAMNKGNAALAAFAATMRRTLDSAIKRQIKQGGK